MFDSSWWLLVTVLGPIVLAASFAYALLNRRRLTSREKQARHEAVEELYDEDHRKRA